MSSIYRILWIVFCFSFVLCACSTPQEGSCTTNGDCLDGQRCIKKVCKKPQAGKPEARISAPSQAAIKSSVLLDGSGSSDPEGNPLSYQWKIIRTPPGSQPDLRDDTAAKATLFAEVPGTYEVELVVTSQDKVSSDPVRVSIELSDKSNNQAPVADAGLDSFSGPGKTLQLDGSGSSDPDGDKLTFKWSFSTKPDGSTAKLNDPSLEKPSITFDKAGKYILKLIVNDGTTDSSPDEVSIDVLEDFDLEPAATKLDPSSAPMDTTPQVTITGTGFSSNAVVLFDGIALPANSVVVKSKTEIKVTLDLKGKTAREYKVTVRNPNEKKTQPLTFTVLDLPTPVLNSIDPTSGLAGGKYKIKLTGTGFVSSSKVLFRLVPLETTYISDTSLEAKLDLSKTVEGDYPIVVRNPGGRSSKEIIFKVMSDGGFAPVLRVLNPPQATVGSKILFSVHGSSFSAGSVIVFDGKEIPSIRQSRDTIEADPELDLTNIPVGNYKVWVRAANGKESNKEDFEVIEKDPAPKLDRVLPPTFYLNDVTKLDVYGKYFDPKIKFYLGTKEYSGAALQSVSTSYFSVTVDTKSGTWKEGNILAYVQNPNGKKSKNFTLTIAKKPTVPGPNLTRVSPTSGESGKSISSFYIYAFNFCTGSSSCSTLPKISFTDANGVDWQAKQTIYTSIASYINRSTPYMRGRLNLTGVPAGTYKVQLIHPKTKAKSNTKTFTVKPPPGIRIDRLNPTSGDVGVDIADFRIYANYFCPGSTKCTTLPKIYIKNSSGTDIQKSTGVYKVSGTYLNRASPYIKGALAVSKMPAGTYTFQIEHPTSGKKSGLKTFSVRKPLPLSLIYLRPYYAKVGSKVKVEVNGSNFTSSSYILVNGTDKISFLSGTSKTRRYFNFDTQNKYKTVKNYNLQVCNSASVCSNIFAYAVQPSTGTNPFISNVRTDAYPIVTGTTLTLHIYGYRWPNVSSAKFLLDGKEINKTNFKYSTRTCKLATSSTSSSNCKFNQFSTQGLAVGKHTIQYKYNTSQSITYDFYIQKP